MKNVNKIWNKSLLSAVLASLLMVSSMALLGQGASAMATPTVSKVNVETISVDAIFPELTLTKPTTIFTGTKTISIPIPAELLPAAALIGDAKLEITYELAQVLLQNLGINNLIRTVDNAASKIMEFLNESELLGFNVNFDEVYAALDVQNFWESMPTALINSPITLSTDGVNVNVTFEETAFANIMVLVEAALANISNAIHAVQLTGQGVVGTFIARTVMDLWVVVEDVYDLFAQTVSDIVETVDFLTLMEHHILDIIAEIEEFYAIPAE
ncbi:adhesive domain-containing protein [Culicoidibacter larvae]|uniref:Putative adhesive domain-containing protein n=1 Tax=Culicoidibacter larvae TaxID=2579976 RepID=A0A5R8QIW4_9FIRM|nr:adhesive domain-containing protein [Culicoidibacter larvae]TLG77393.1 hypothetical protein FEZ08_01880 [Culicoidibacter larvae]